MLDRKSSAVSLAIIVIVGISGSIGSAMGASGIFLLGYYMAMDKYNSTDE